MSEQSVDPGSWAANRSDVGWALLCTIWSAAFAVGAVVLDEGALLIVSGLLGAVCLLSLTLVGWRLAFR